MQPFVGAEGGSWTDQVSVVWRLLGVTQGTLEDCCPNVTVVNGRSDLDFLFKITENLEGILNLTANTNGRVLPPLNDDTTTGSGLTDGIGVNGSVTVAPADGVAVYEAYFRHRVTVGDSMVHYEIGKIDPRIRFSQNAFADSEYTQFINNLFDDSPSMIWLSDNTSGRTYLGVYTWMDFGENEAYTVSAGWFNTPGEFFTQGQFLVQFGWKIRQDERPMNVYIFAFVDEFFRDATGDGGSGGGASWDWQVKEKIGIFVRITATGSDANPVELDASLGAAFTGVFGSRPDDVLGVAVGFLTLRDEVTTLISKDGESDATFGPFLDDEIHVEVYWNFMLEEGQYQITPAVLYVNEYAGGTGGAEGIFILSLRLFVYF